MGRTAGDLLIFADPVNKTVEILDVAGDFMAAISLATIASDSFRKPFDCCFLSIYITAVTDVSPDQNSLQLVFINTK